jgi:hypothetical protein
MTLAATLVLSAPFLLQNGVSIQSGTISQKAESRDCALNVANVAGNVTVQNCPGIPAKAIEGLNHELKARRLSEDQARREAEDWRQKYEGLQASLASAGLSQALTKKAQSCLEQGDLTGASKALDEALKQQDQQVLEAASTHYFRARVAELAFDTKLQGEQLETAYRLAPHVFNIATVYGNFLNRYGRPSEAESVFKKLIDGATPGNADAVKENAIATQAAILIGVAASLSYQGKFAEAKENYLEAASLWEICSRQQVEDSLNNEAVAFSAAAYIARVQLHREEAQELIGKAIALARRSLTQEKDSSPLQIHRFDLVDCLLSSAETYVDAGDLDSGFAACEEAIRVAMGVSAPVGISALDLANLVKGYLGRAKTLECDIFSLRHNPLTARGYCDDALLLLARIKDQNGGPFQPDLAKAYFMSGLVQEDMHLWTKALASFRQADSVWSELLEKGQPQFKIDQAKVLFYSIGAAFYSGDKHAAADYARRAVLLADSFPPEFNEFRGQVLREAAKLMDIVGSHTEAAEFNRERDKLMRTSKP